MSKAKVNDAMRLVVAAIGRLKDGPERELAERYRKRAEQTGRRIGFRDMEVVEIRESRAQEVGKRMVEELIALANVIPDKAVILILDERGESLDSATLASRLGRWRDDGRPAARVHHRRRRRPRAEPARQGERAARVRRRHLAAPARAGHAAGADLSRRQHPVRASVSPRLTCCVSAACAAAITFTSPHEQQLG